MNETGSGQPNSTDSMSLFALLTFFVLLLSLLGFLIVIALSLGHMNYIMNITVILYYSDQMEFYEDPKKPVHFKTMCRYFYEITIALFTVLSLFYGSPLWSPLDIFYENPLMLFLVFIVVFISIEGLQLLLWRKYFRDRKDFIEVLQKDTERFYAKDWPRWFKKPNFWIGILKDAKKTKRKNVKKRKR